MAAVGLQPIVLRDAALSIGAAGVFDEYVGAVTEVTFMPQLDYDWEVALDGDSIPIYMGLRWTVTIGFAQDLDTENSLTRFLLENAAAVRSVRFEPTRGIGPTVQGEVMLTPPQLGGRPGEKLLASATLPLYGQPEVS